jgi:hypothetical protein
MCVVFIGFFVCSERMPKKGKKKPCLALTHGIRQGNFELDKRKNIIDFFICQAQAQK